MMSGTSVTSMGPARAFVFDVKVSECAVFNLCCTGGENELAPAAAAVVVLTVCAVLPVGVGCIRIIEIPVMLHGINLHKPGGRHATIVPE